MRLCRTIRPRWLPRRLCCRAAYTVRLIAGGKTLTQPFKVVMDPRVKTPMADLEAQFQLSKAIYDDAMRATAALHEITVLREQLAAKGTPSTPAEAAPDSLESKLTKIAGGVAKAAAAAGAADAEVREDPPI